jgi:uncharacterized protein
MARPIHILSLDGGGSWALIQAMTLGNLYGMDTPGRQILRHFDFAFGNSGGSVIIAGLMVDQTPAMLLQQFLDPTMRAAMFTPLPRTSIWRWVRLRFDVGPKYQTEPKRQALRARGLNVPLETVVHADGHHSYVVIVGFDYDRERAFFFRSKPSLRTHAVEVNLADAVHASSTAPVNYFQMPADVEVRIEPSKTSETIRFWDGAITGLNNPAVVAVAEALSVGKRPDDIAVLSIGTAGNMLPNTRSAQTADSAYVLQSGGVSVFDGAKKLATAVVNDPPDLASFLAHTALCGRTPAKDGEPTIGDTAIVRMNPALTPRWDASARRWDHPEGLDATTFKRLLALAMDATSAADVDMIVAMATAWMQDKVTNQPIRFHFRDPDRGMVAEIGHLKFSEARARWKAIAPKGVL